MMIIFLVIVTLKLFDETRNFSSKTIHDYLHRDIVLPASPTHIDINAEQKLLAVAYIYNQVPILRIYVVDSFFAPVSFIQLIGMSLIVY